MVQSTVSVIIPAYNSAGFLSDALESVIDQTYRPLELLVIDDGSTDETVELTERWLEDHAQVQGFQGRLLRQSHRGGGAARNLGIVHAGGEWIQFLDADDTITADKIGRQIKILDKKGSVLSYGSWRYLSMQAGSYRPGKLRQALPLSPGDDPLKRHLEGWFCPLHSYLWPRSILKSLGGFDPSLAADQDADLVMRALVAGATLLFTPGVEVLYRLHDCGQVSSSRSRSKMRSRLRVVRKIAQLLEADGRLDSYRESLAIRCDGLERAACLLYPEFSRLCHRAANHFAPGHRPLVSGGMVYRLSRRMLGLYLSEWLSMQKRRLFVGRSAR